MARQSNSDKLSQYRQKLNLAQKVLEQQNYIQLWQRLINLYRGRHYRGAGVGDRLLVNVAFSTINTLAPAIAIGRPKINVNPRRPEDGDKAVVTESIINYWWQHYGCQPEFQRAAKDYLIIGHGWVKTGYRFVEEAKLDKIQDTADEAASMENPPTGDVESTFVIREDRPFLERVDPFNMYVDPYATDMNDLRWIAQKSRRTLKDVKNDERYDYSARQSVGPAVNTAAIDYLTTNAYDYNYDTEEAMCNIFEYYNIDTGEMCIFSDTGDKFLVKPVKMPYVFGHPFIMLRNYEIPGFFYPMGELEAIEPLQYELNETRTQMMNHRKRFSRKYLFSESAFDDIGRQALASDDDNVLVPVKGNENLSNVVAAMPAYINPPEFYQMSASIEADIDRVSGVSEYQRGSIPETTRTAREASIIAEAGNARVSEKLIQIENCIAACASNLIMLAQQYLTGEQTVRIVGTENAPVWLTFDKDYIAGEFDFNVEAGSTAPRNEAFRRDMALQIVSAMQPFAQAGLVNLNKLAEYVLSTGFGVKNAGAFLQEAPAPQGPEGMTPDQAALEGQGLPPGMAPDQMAAMQSEQGGQGLPPELMAALQGGQGGPPQAGMEGLPPELLAALQGGQGGPPQAGIEGLPPELLAALQGGAPGGLPAEGGAQGLPPELAAILAQAQGELPSGPEVPAGLEGMPPDLIQAIILAEQQRQAGQ
jgi:hypothetical protein